MNQRWLDALRWGAQWLSALLFPPRCWRCQTAVSAAVRLCGECLEGLPRHPHGFCLGCAAVLQPEEAEHHPCRAALAWAGFEYAAPISDLIIALKYGDRPELAPLLGELGWRELGSSLTTIAPELVIPVPLHPMRLLRRNFNQSALIGRELAARLGVPLVTDGLFRVRATPQQTTLPREARWRNVAGAFRADPDRVAGKSVLLVDDVLTTGATVSSAVSALVQARAGKVSVACIAHSMRG